MNEGGRVLLGRYLLGQELGRGAFGRVFQAEDLALDGRPVAIKVSHNTLSCESEALDDVKREALLAMRLSHPNIVTLRAFEIDGDDAFLVMDLVEGASLQTILDRKGVLSSDDVRCLFIPLAQGLQYAHDSGVVHRDLKPGNILVARDGIPKIADFGIAQLTTVGESQQGRVAGTLAFMSPQQLLGHSPDPRDDIYSLALTIYTCLVGRPPFCQGNIEEAILEKLPDPIDIPDRALAGTVMRALAKAPHRRPQTMREFASLLAGGETRPSDRHGDRSRSHPNETNPFPQNAQGLSLSQPSCGAFALEIIDNGRTLSPVEDNSLDTSWICATPGQEFAIKIINASSRRIAGVLSVDGLSVHDRCAARMEDVAFVVAPRTHAVVHGWRVNADRIEAFRFAHAHEGLAAKNKQATANVGHIACAIFFERLPVPVRQAVAPRSSMDSADSVGVLFAAARDEPDGPVARLAVGTGRGWTVRSRTVSFTRANSNPNLILGVRYTSAEGMRWMGLDQAGQKSMRGGGLDNKATDAQDEFGYGDIHHAVFNSDICTVRELIEAGVDVNACSAPSAKHFLGATALHIAAHRGEWEIAEYLLAHGANIEARTCQYHDTALHLCCCRAWSDGSRGMRTLDLLISHGADFRSKNGQQHAPLHLAACYATPRVIERLLEYGSGDAINWVDHEGDTPIDCAAAEQNYVNADFLRSYGGQGRRADPYLSEFDVAENVARAWNSGSWDHLLHQFEADAVYLSPGRGVRVVGGDAIVKYLSSKRREFGAKPESRLIAELGQLTVDDRSEACVVISEGRADSPVGLMRVKARGDRISHLSHESMAEYTGMVQGSGWMPA